MVVIESLVAVAVGGGGGQSKEGSGSGGSAKNKDKFDNKKINGSGNKKNLNKAPSFK